MSSMSSHEKKMKEEKKFLLLSLPDKLLLSCVARVSRLYYPTLSLVSKRFQSLIASPELYKARSLLGVSESCLYVYFSLVRESLWFTLCRKPNSSDFILAKVPIPHSPRAKSESLVAVGSNIYNIGTANVKFLDCQSHTWCDAPRMREKKLKSVYASVVDQKIYVAGRVDDGVSVLSWNNSIKNSVVVFDTITQVLDPVRAPCSDIQGETILESACIDGKFHLKTHGHVVAYDSKEVKWDVAGLMMGEYMNSDAYCEIGNVLYSVDDGVFKWYDAELSMWRELKGLVGLPRYPSRVKLADYGGKMAVFWDSSLLCNGGYETKIWCAEVALKKSDSGEILGEVEWFGQVLTLQGVQKVAKVLVATV